MKSVRRERKGGHKSRNVLRKILGPVSGVTEDSSRFGRHAKPTGKYALSS